MKYQENISIKSINLSKQDQRIISFALNEYDGGSDKAMYSISGHSKEEIASLQIKWDTNCKLNNNEITLTHENWRIVYNSINAVLYALGPHELETISGQEPIEFLQTNLIICNHLWGTYAGLKWTESYNFIRK